MAGINITGNSGGQPPYSAKDRNEAGSWNSYIDGDAKGKARFAAEQLASQRAGFARLERQTQIAQKNAVATEKAAVKSAAAVEAEAHRENRLITLRAKFAKKQVADVETEAYKEHRLHERREKFLDKQWSSLLSEAYFSNSVSDRKKKADTQAAADTEAEAHREHRLFKRRESHSAKQWSNYVSQAYELNREDTRKKNAMWSEAKGDNDLHKRRERFQKKQKDDVAKQERETLRQAAEHDREVTRKRRFAALTDPETYYRSGVSGLGRSGMSDAMGGDKQAAKKALRRLDKIEGRTQRLLKKDPNNLSLQSTMQQIGQSRAQIKGGLQFGSGANGTGVDEMLDVLNPLSWFKMAMGAVKTVWKAPGMISSMSEDLENKARPYTDLVRAGTDLGRSNGFEGMDLVSKFYTHGRPPAWMQRMGLTPGEAMSIAGSTGLPVASADAGQALVENLTSANRMSGLAGMGTERLGQVLNTGRTLGIVNSDGGGDGAYFKRWSDIITKATGLGMDRSRTMNNLEGLFRQSAASAPRVDMNRIANDYMQMAAGGSAGGRSGQLQSDVAGGMAAATDKMGLGGDPGTAAIMHYRMQQVGGQPKTREALAKMFHISKEELADFEAKGGKAAVEQMLGAQSEVMFNEYAKPLKDSFPDGYRQIVHESPLRSAMPKDQQDAWEAAQLGLKTDPFQRSDPRYLPPRGAGGGGGVAGSYSDKNLAKSDLQFFMSKGWSKVQAMGILANIAQESSGNANQPNGDGLAQWSDPKRRKLFLDRYHHDVAHSTRDEQLDFINWELNNNYADAGNHLRGITANDGSSARLLRKEYEQPKDADGTEDAKRTGAYTKLDKQLADVPENAAMNPINEWHANGGAMTVNTGLQNAEAGKFLFTGASGGLAVDAQGAAVDMAVASLDRFKGALDEVVDFIHGKLTTPAPSGPPPGMEEGPLGHTFNWARRAVAVPPPRRGPNAQSGEGFDFNTPLVP